MKKLIAMSAIALAVAGCSESDDPENVLGQITISGTAESGQTLTATVSDENGVDSSAISYTWSAGGTTISGATSSTLTLTDAHVGQAIAVSASYTDNDNFEETVNSSSVTVANQDAVFSGDLVGAVTKNSTSAVTGTIAVADPDGDDTVEAQTDFASTYGSFSIAADGSWSYIVDTSNSTVASLASDSDTITDSIFVSAADGTTTSVTITISGVAADKVAKISDSDDGDTGELYYKFDSGTNTGKLSLSFLYGVDEDQTAYISLYDTEGSTKSLIGELIMDEGKFGLRINTFDDGAVPSKNTNASSSIDYDAIDAPDFTPGEWIDIVMTWDNSSTTDTGTYSVMIDGTTYGPFASQHPTPGVEVEAITVRLADNSKSSTDAVYVNDLMIYSDVAGTTSIFSQDFEGFTVGDKLDDSNSASPFGSRTFEAEVVIYGQDNSDPGNGGGNGGNGGGDLGEGDVAPGTAGNKVALIMDTMSDDAGELRYKLSTSDIVTKGKMTASFMKTASSTCTLDSNVKDAYVAIYGGSTSSYNALVDLRIDGSDYDTDFALRHKNEDGNKTVNITNASFTADTWMHVEMTWDATNATADTGPLMTVSINGTSVAPAWNSYSESLVDVQSGAQTFVFKLGDTSSVIPDCKFYVDNIKVYSTDDSGDTIVWADNFESYESGVSLDTDNSASTYHSNTAEAVVATETGN